MFRFLHLNTFKDILRRQMVHQLACWARDGLGAMIGVLKLPYFLLRHALHSFILCIYSCLCYNIEQQHNPPAENRKLDLDKKAIIMGCWIKHPLAATHSWRVVGLLIVLLHAQQSHGQSIHNLVIDCARNSQGEPPKTMQDSYVHSEQPKQVTRLACDNHASSSNSDLSVSTFWLPASLATSRCAIPKALDTYVKLNVESNDTFMLITTDEVPRYVFLIAANSNTYSIIKQQN